MLSYVRGPKRSLFEATIDQVVRDTAERFPDREAVVSRHQNRRLTWREFHSEAERVSRGLAGLSLQSQDRVGIWASNCVEWLLLQVACSRANLVLVNVNPAYRAHDLSYVLRTAAMDMWSNTVHNADSARFRYHDAKAEKAWDYFGRYANVKYFDLSKEMYAKRRMLILDGHMSGKWTVKQEELIRQLGLPKN